MYKSLTAATIILGLALAPVLSGGGEGELEDDNVVLSPRELDARARDEADEPADTARSCEWECRACEPERGCTQICTEVGDCGSACDMIAQCDSTHRWDETTCGCI